MVKSRAGKHEHSKYPVLNMRFGKSELAPERRRAYNMAVFICDFLKDYEV